MAKLADIAMGIGEVHFPDGTGPPELVEDLENLERSEWLQVWSSVLFLHKYVSYLRPDSV